MKAVKIICAAAFALTLASCGGTEPNDFAYAVAIGFDKAETEGDYLITIQFAKPTQISGGASEEGGKGGSEIVENISVEAPNLYAGVGLANNVVSKKFSLSHTKIIVISAEAAKEGISDIVKTVSRNEEIRPDIYLAVAKNSARDYLYSVSPSVEVNPAKYYQLIYEGNSKPGVSSNSALDFSFNYKNKNADPVLPLAGVAGDEDADGSPLTQNLNSGTEIKEGEDGEKENAENNGVSGEKSEGSQGGEDSPPESGSPESGSSGGGNEGEGSGGSQNPRETENRQQKTAVKTDGKFEYKLKDYIAGQAALNSADKSEAVGMAVFKGDKALFITGAVEAELFNMLNGGLKETYLSLDCGEGDTVTLKVEQEKKPKIKIDKKNKKLDITLFLESNLYTMPGDNVTQRNIKELEKTAKEEITEASEKFINEVIKKNGVDILGFKRKFKQCFLTNKDYEENRDAVMEYDMSVETRFVIRRTGLTLWEE